MNEKLHPQAASADSARSDQPRVGRSRILIVEDEDDLRFLLEVQLITRGYDVASVADGRSALDAIARVEPDLIVLDMMLPHLDGFGVIAAVRENRRTRQLPIIMVTARVDLQELLDQGRPAP